MNKEHQMVEAQVLKKQGLKQFQIADILGVTDRTVRNYLKSPATPRKKSEKHSKLDPFRQIIDSIIAADPFYNCVLPVGYRSCVNIQLKYAKEWLQKR